MRLFSATLVLGLILMTREAGMAVDFYVSPKGNDGWSGKLAAPNRARSDGPFLTIAAALNAVREVRASQGRNVPVNVWIRKGTYLLDKTLELGPEHSGSENAPTVIAAYKNEKPRISGGVPLTGWRVENGAWKLHLPQVQAGEWYFEQLFVNGQRRYRPRLPKRGYYFIAQAAPTTEKNKGKGFDGFVYRDEDIRPDWHNIDDVHLLCFQIWSMARMTIESVDPATKTVRLKSPTLAEIWFTALDAGKRYIVENVREALTEPGEWYLDRKSGELTYLPMKGERPEKAEVFAPRLEYLLVVRGKPDEKQWAEHIEFRGLTFEHSNWVTDRGGYQAAQAEWPIGGAVHFHGCRHVRLNNSVVRHVGGYAVEIHHASQRCAVENSTLTDMGAGGVKIGLTTYVQDPELLASHNRIHNNLIAHGGRMHPAGIGVWVGASPYNVISHNEICDFYYTGISLGWAWGYFNAGAQGNIIEYNHVHHIGQGVLSDMGATYSLSLSPGAVQRYNVFHDIESYSYGGWGIYFDEGTGDMLAENNLVYRCSSAGFHQHYGINNIVRNNIFAFNRDSQVMRTRAEDHLSFTFERNIVIWDRGPLLASNWSGNNYKFQKNLYWRTDGASFDFAGMSLEEWRAKGQDVDSVIKDPLFVNPKKRDFRLKPGSPASEIGFVPFDYTKAGRVGIGLSKSTPVAKPRAYPGPPPPPPPAPIRLDFEDHPVGAKAAVGDTFEETETATIRVTEETAHSGRRSLKFVDQAGQQYNFNPHYVLSPRFADGVVQASFAIRVEPGTYLYHQWRIMAAATANGPSLYFRPDGSLYAGDQKLMDFPHSQWFVVEIRCAVGKKADGTYSVVVKLPGRTAPLRFDKLPCSKDFHRLDWFGFVADADGPGVFYLDDIKVSN